MAKKTKRKYTKSANGRKTRATNKQTERSTAIPLAPPAQSFMEALTKRVQDTKQFNEMESSDSRAAVLGMLAEAIVSQNEAITAIAQSTIQAPNYESKHSKLIAD